ncbi:MAG: hypothetical protein JOZ54_06150, partial [Acidobacteria bacterium]|nr:hypothetical protein [Acidobacteriota bacterium]
TSNRLGNFERGVLFERNALQTAFKNYEDLREASGAVLFTYLHRLHHYATTRNDDAAELTREALTPQPSRRRGFGRKRTLAKLDDPLTTMQFRALDWIFRNEAHLMEKRSRVQALRRMPDREIFARFPLHIVPTYPGDESLMAGPLFDLLRPRLPSSARKLGDIIRT